MGYKLRISETAERDIDDTLSYMTEKLKNPDAAMHFFEDVEKTYRVLEDNPYIYSLCPETELSQRGYRKAIIKNFLIFYQIYEDSQTVKIVAVIYGGRNYAEWL